jgi:lipoprotein-releasing system permease protein
MNIFKKPELLIASRYVFPKGNINFISIITLISIFGIAIGVSALVIVMSIFNGFRIISIDALLEMDPAIRIISNNSAYIENYSQIINNLTENIEVDSHITIIPKLQTKAALINKNLIEVVELIAPIEVKKIKHNSINNAKFTFSNEIVIGVPSIDSIDVVLGIALAERLKTTIYDSLKLISTKMLEYSFQTLQIPSGVNVRATGLFQGNIKDYDLTYCYTSPQVFSKLTNIPSNEATYLDIFIEGNDTEQIEIIAKNIKKFLPANLNLLTWMDLNRELYNIMQMERVAVFSVMSLILLIAVFNVFASLAMTVTEKKSEIAILMSIGCGGKLIIKIYMIEGLLIGIIGTISGLIIGVGLIIAQQQFNLIQLDGTAYITNSLPVILNGWEVVVICIFSLLLSFIATLFPARKAMNISILNSI